jgi:hypothetical protein
VELEKPGVGPNKTLLKTEEGDCGPEGAGGDKGTNLLKNRTDVPETIRDASTQDIERLQALKVPLRRDDWTSEDLAKATGLGDGSGIRVQGYLLLLRRQGETSSNCKFAHYVDWHLVLGSSPDTPFRDGIVAVIGPRIRLSHPYWTQERLDELSSAKLPVRVTGWLFFAQYHLIGPWNYNSLWQVTPAVKIEFLRGQVWLDLDDGANPIAQGVSTGTASRHLNGMLLRDSKQPD